MALKYGGLTIPPAAVLNAVGKPQPLALAGARALVPLVYGQTRATGRVLNVVRHATDATLVLVQVYWCHACNALSSHLLNDLALPGGASSTTYTGSQASADATLAAAFAAQGITYTDTLSGFAYTVYALPVREFTGQLKFSALVQGRKLYDPRKDTTNGGSGSHRLATPSTWEYSDNPALALADWLYSSVYGAGEAVVWSSVITQANLNDANIGSPAETHRKIGWSIEAAAPVPDMREALRAYAGCWLVPTGSGIKMVADADAATSATYAHASGQIAALSNLRLRDSGNSPTVVEVVYTDTSQTPYREASAFAQLAGAGTTLPWRVSTVRLPGIQRYSQALREATERLNKLTLSDLSCDLDVFDIGVRHEVGDIVAVTHPAGLSSKLFRIGEPPVQTEPGRWRLALSEHDPAVYSTTVATTPTYTNAGVLISEADIDAGGNLLRNSSFEADSNADGLADNWVAYSAGTTGTVSYSRPTNGPVHGTYKQRFSGAGLGTAASDRVGAYQQVNVIGGEDYVLSVWHGNPTGGPKLRLYIDWYNASNAIIGSADDVFSPAGTLARASLRATAPATATYARAYLWMQANSAGPGLATLDIDAAQFQAGTVLTGYVPGDWGTADLLQSAATELASDSDTTVTTTIGAGASGAQIPVSFYWENTLGFDAAVEVSGAANFTVTNTNATGTTRVDQTRLTIQEQQFSGSWTFVAERGEANYEKPVPDIAASGVARFQFARTQLALVPAGRRIYVAIDVNVTNLSGAACSVVARDPWVMAAIIKR